MSRFLLLPAVLCLALLAVGVLVHHLSLFALLGMLLFAGAAILNWTRHEVSRP